MFLKRGGVILGLFAAVVLLPYVRGPLYRFPDPLPFAGGELENPYAGIGSAWQRANLHAHGRAWSGLTNGRLQSDEEIVRAYRSFGRQIYPGNALTGSGARVELLDRPRHIGCISYRNALK